MEENADIIDALFDKQEDDDLFNMKDELLEELSDKIEKCTEDIQKFIEKRVHPRSRTKLRKLLKRKEKSLYSYLRRENQLFYKNGVSDGISLVLLSLTFK